jgi:hypothetical protein
MQCPKLLASFATGMFSLTARLSAEQIPYKQLNGVPARAIIEVRGASMRFSDLRAGTP